MKYDLEARVTEFGKRIITYTKLIKITPTTRSLIEQLSRSATSVGANYFEANGACSKKDFINKIYFCKKEAKETQYWLTLIDHAYPNLGDQNKILLDETIQLIMIFSSILKTAKNEFISNQN